MRKPTTKKILDALESIGKHNEFPRLTTREMVFLTIAAAPIIGALIEKAIDYIGVKPNLPLEPNNVPK